NTAATCHGGPSAVYRAVREWRRGHMTGGREGAGMRVRSTVVAAVLAIAAVRCVDLSLVTQFAEASRGVAVALPRIAQQASAACLRANGFINDANHVDSLPCGAYATLNPAIDEVNSALFAYIAALGKLASADISKTGSGFDNLSADLTKG